MSDSIRNPVTGAASPAAVPRPKSDAEIAGAVHAAICKMADPTATRPPEGAEPLPLEELALVNQGRLSETDLLKIYADLSGLQTVDEEQHTHLEPFPDVTFNYLTHGSCLPLAWDAGTVTLAVTSPYHLGTLQAQWLTLFRRRVAFILARQSWVERMLTAVYDKALHSPDGMLSLDGDASEEALRDLAREAPIVRLVNDIFSRAVEMGASDIHVEPSEEQLAIRYRVDGLLQTVLTPPKAHYNAVSSRIKLLAGMNIAERRLPQDGRIDLQTGRAQLDIRVSSVPSMHGESIVLRLLRKDVAVFDLDRLGLDAQTKKQFTDIVAMPHGMFLVVGPTGSGKTTTLYCVMKILNAEDTKIITLEDPVEYQMPGLTQIQVRAQIGLTFASGLRSIVRQDPDIILVGEIRDRETAEIAIHAALTGHLVLSTLHTNDAPGAISRLLDMGVEGFLISSALLGVLSQRLVRRICPECHGSGHGTGADAAGGAKRCRNCSGSGFRSRVGIYELMAVNDEIRQAINSHKDSSEIAALARHNGMRTLREDGENKVRDGVTTPAEVARVCQLDFAD